VGDEFPRLAGVPVEADRLEPVRGLPKQGLVVAGGTVRSERASSNTLFPLLSHDPGPPEPLAAMDAASRGGVRSQSAAPRASLAESRARCRVAAK